MCVRERAESTCTCVRLCCEVLSEHSESEVNNHVSLPLHPPPPHDPRSDAFLLSMQHM